MTLRELFNHITNKTTLMDLHTPLWRHCAEVREFEKELTDKILDSEISNWTFTNKFVVDM